MRTFSSFVGSWSYNPINFSLVPSPVSSLSKSRTDVLFFNYPAGDLAFQVLFGPFSEEQRDIIMEVLTSMFCYKHSKVTFKVSLAEYPRKGSGWLYVG